MLEKLGRAIFEKDSASIAVDFGRPTWEDLKLEPYRRDLHYIELVCAVIEELSGTSDASKPQNCPYCGKLHERTVCGLIKAIEYFPNGTTKRVEFHGPAPLINYPPPHYPAPVPQWPFDLPFPQIT